MVCTYLFEVSGIQHFVFATGKLRDASGASELLSSLAYVEQTDRGPVEGGLFSEIIDAAGFSAQIEVFRCAGGVVEFSCPDDDEQAMFKFRTLWRLAVAARAPGVEFADGLGFGDTSPEARNAARTELNHTAVQVYSNWPPSAPIVRPAARTDAAPAIWEDANASNGTCRITHEFADAPTLVKRHFLANSSNLLAQRFVVESAPSLKWPVLFEPDPNHPDEPIFPFTSERHRLALIHIDGNGVGGFFSDLPHQVSRRAVSTALSVATERAAALAMKQVIEARDAEDVVPARPILLGGDDLTVIVRADFAFLFADTFASAFEEETARAFQEIEGLETHSGLTAKAGIVFMGPKQPFRQAYELCEELAGAARAQTSQVSFWRLTGSMIPADVDEIEELTTVQTGKDGDSGKLTLWRKTWSWGDLRALQKLALMLNNEHVGRSALRQVPELILSSEAREEKSPIDVYLRALSVLKSQPKNTHRAFVAAMASLGVENPMSSFSAGGYVPLLDAHVLAQLGLGEPE